MALAPKSAKQQAIEEVTKIEEDVKVEVQRFNIDIPKALHKRFKIHAATEEITMNALATKVFENYLNALGSK